MGYEVAEVLDGREGLGLFLRSPFNLVITDLSIPEGDGISPAFSIKEKSPPYCRFLIQRQDTDRDNTGVSDERSKDTHYGQ